MAIKVSVCIITYNHEKFIAQAIDSVLMQEVDFDYEIIIGEDDSTDNTRNIVKEYKERYPEKIRLFLNDRKNVIYINGRPTGRWNFTNNLKHAKGEYIAILEGDDYWTSPHKLQKQVDFLDSHPDFTICSHNVHIKYEDQKKPMVQWLGSDHQEVMDLEYLLGEGPGGATCSLVFRKDALGELPDWYYKIRSGDTALQILCASNGKMKYFRNVMGIYRKHSAGFSVLKPDSQAEIDRYYWQGPVKQEIINKHFNYRYDKLIRKKLIRYYSNLINAHLNNIGRHINESKKYALKILREDPTVSRILLKKRIRLYLFILINNILRIIISFSKRL